MLAMSRYGAGIGWKFYFLSQFLVLLWGIFLCVKLLIEFIFHPVLFLKRPTERLIPPECMLDASLGKHEYIRANGIKFHCVTSGDNSKPLMLFLHGFPEVCECVFMFSRYTFCSPPSNHSCMH